MTSLRCYHRFIIAAALFGAAAAVAGLTLLILNIPMPGTICLITGSVIGLLAGMEWRCRERPVPIYIVKPPPLPQSPIDVVVIATPSK